jgi:hypothetical protein
MIPPCAYGMTATLTWDKSSSADVSKYFIYQSRDPFKNYKKILEVGGDKNIATFDITDDYGLFWYITVVDSSGNESGKSNIVNDVFIIWFKKIFGKLP